MKSSFNLASMPDLAHPISLAIGTFDGVHLGHRLLINTMKRFGKTVVVFTFPNHPREVLMNIHVPYLTPAEYKLQLLKEAGVDFCLMQSFSKDMANMTYNLFLEEIYSAFPFEHIFFGENDAIGKNREGTREKVELLGKALGFEAHYLPKLVIDGELVSSSRIRSLLALGDFNRAAQLLGRTFAISTTLENPYVDPLLLKPGLYKFTIYGKNQIYECSGKVDSTGIISFDTKPPFALTEQMYKVEVICQI